MGDDDNDNNGEDRRSLVGIKELHHALPISATARTLAAVRFFLSRVSDQSGPRYHRERLQQGKDWALKGGSDESTSADGCDFSYFAAISGHKCEEGGSDESTSTEYEFSGIRNCSAALLRTPCLFPV